MSFCGWVAHFFLVLKNIPLSGCTAVYPPAERRRGCFRVWAVMNKSAAVSPCVVFVRTSVLSSFGSIPRSLLDLKGKRVSFCKEPRNWLPRGLYHFAFPPATYEGCSPASPAFGVVSVLDFDHPDRYAMMIFTYMFLSCG